MAHFITKIEPILRKIARKIARTIVRFPAKWYFNHQFKTAFTDDYDAFWVVDIDNTIADSWKKMTPQYDNAFRSQSDKMMSFDAFEAMQRLFQDVPPRTRIPNCTAIHSLFRYQTMVAKERFLASR